MTTDTHSLTEKPAEAIASTPPKPPVAKRIPVERVLHGDKRVDDYAWLHEKENAEVLAYLKAENTYTDAVMRPAEVFQEKLYQEMLGRIQQTDISAPYRLRGFLYFTRTEEGKQYGIHCRRRDIPDSPEEVLLDLNALALDHAFFSMDVFEVSPDNCRLAY